MSTELNTKKKTVQKAPLIPFVFLIFGTYRTHTGTMKSFPVHSSKDLGMDFGGPLFL